LDGLSRIEGEGTKLDLTGLLEFEARLKSELAPNSELELTTDLIATNSMPNETN
jgi:hypothetical protein